MVTSQPDPARTRLPVTPSDAPANGARKPCAENLEQNVLALRAWYVTLGDSLVNGTAVPPPEHRDPAARKRLLHCARMAISAGSRVRGGTPCWSCGPVSTWTCCGALEEHLGRTQEPVPEAAARQADAPATASAE